MPAPTIAPTPMKSPADADIEPAGVSFSVFTHSPLRSSANHSPEFPTTACSKPSSRPGANTLACPLTPPRTRRDPRGGGGLLCVSVAEREGFEPSVRGLPAQRFSRPPHSTTLPPLRWREQPQGRSERTCEYSEGTGAGQSRGVRHGLARGHLRVTNGSDQRVHTLTPSNLPFAALNRKPR